MPVESPVPRYVSRITRSERWTSAKALVESLPPARHPWQLSLSRALAYKVVHLDPSHIHRGCQQAVSQYPFLYSADLVWDSEHNVALYVFKTTESDVYDINRRLTEGTCELFKRHPTHTDPMRYLGTFRLVEGVFPYSDSQMNFCRKSLKASASTLKRRTAGDGGSYEFAVLEQVGWNDAVVEKLGGVGLVQLVAAEVPQADDAD